VLDARCCAARPVVVLVEDGLEEEVMLMKTGEEGAGLRVMDLDEGEDCMTLGLLRLKKGGGGWFDVNVEGGVGIGGVKASCEGRGVLCASEGA